MPRTVLQTEMNKAWSSQRLRDTDKQDISIQGHNRLEKGSGCCAIPGTDLAQCLGKDAPWENKDM